VVWNEGLRRVEVAMSENQNGDKPDVAPVVAIHEAETATIYWMCWLKG